MLKYFVAFSVSILLYVSLVFVWGSYTLLDNLSGLLDTFNNSPVYNKPPSEEIKIALDTSIAPDKLDPGYYETLEETITRLQRDVIVTGTLTGISGQESAMFKIEGISDRVFYINTQLMDGFIITEITSSYVVLKNQLGNETISLQVQNGSETSSDTILVNSEPSDINGLNPQILPVVYSNSNASISNNSDSTRKIPFLDHDDRLLHLIDHNETSPLNTSNREMDNNSLFKDYSETINNNFPQRIPDRELLRN